MPVKVGGRIAALTFLKLPGYIVANLFLLIRRMTVNIFRCLNAGKVQWTSLEKIVKIIRTSPLLRAHTMQARNYFADGNRTKGNKIKKNKLPAFAPAGYLLGGKGRVNLIGLTSICFIDIDYVGEEEVNRCMELLQVDEHVLMAAKSISGEGLHILVPYTIKRDDPFESLPAEPKKLNQIYGKVFGVIAGRYGQMLGVPFDKEARNAERLCLISYDADALFNPQALPIEFRYEELITNR